jgi:hypothetical protein
MAGLAGDFRLTGRVLGPGLLWGGLPIPAANARITTATNADGIITPDATANPAAYPIGATADGVTCSARTSRTDLYADEIVAPVDTVKNQSEMSIAAKVMGIADAVVAKLITSGFGTQTTVSGFVDNRMGTAADVFTGIALIAPMREDPTKIFVFHVYKAINDSGFSFGVNKSGLASSDTLFKGYAVTTRAITDQLGNYWWTTA